VNPIRLVISGFQTGADIGGIRAARRFSIPTSGYISQGFRTLAGPRPEYASLYGAREHPSPAYPPRTKSNVLWADAVLWFGSHRTVGGRLTLRLCDQFHRPYHLVPDLGADPEEAHGWLLEALWDTEGLLLIAGNRDTPSHPMEQWVERWLTAFFRDCLGLQELESVTSKR
jgi:hypothetical protein